MPRKSLASLQQPRTKVCIFHSNFTSSITMDDSASDLPCAPQVLYTKRRRVNGTHPRSRYSSPDELAASCSDHETPVYHRRTSSGNPNRTSAETQNRSYAHSPPDDSPDELDHTIRTFYRGGMKRNLQLSASRHATPDAPSEISMLTPIQAPASPTTTVPPGTPLPPPAKEARYLPYKQKMVLNGHRKGVAAVRFSPKGDKIASCCQ